MRLNIDCIRDILLCVEENTTYLRGVKFYDSYSQLAGEPLADDGIPKCNEPLFEKYGDDVVLYHVEYCFDDNLIVKDDKTCEPYIGIKKLTPQGHSVLDDIRDQNVLEKAKSVAKNLGLGSLPSLRKIIPNVATDLIENYFRKK